MDLDDARSQATALKEKGNEAFKKHDYPTSVDLYSQAIERYGKEPSFYTNRAQVGGPMLVEEVACRSCLLTWFM
jgi:hypothetical protein